MSGHSKWSTIKHKKAAADAARGKVFTKLIKEITVAARLGGGDIESNPRLRDAVSRARAANMPKDNIEKAIKKGTGELPGVVYEEIVYEGYGPEGTALYIEVTTDNRNRTVAEIRYLLSKHGGNLGENGSVAWMFDRKGVIWVAKANYDEDELTLSAIEAGAEDVVDDDDENYEIHTEATQVNVVAAKLKAAGIQWQSAEISMIPQNTIKLEGNNAQRMLKLMEVLDDHDDVQSVSSNFDIDAEAMAAYEG
jgi:YebC/PmpR family DNA-binding regulatory protein